MGTVSSKIINVDPKTPAQVRQVLSRLQRTNDDTTTDLTVIDNRLDDLETNVGVGVPTAIADTDILKGQPLRMPGTGHIDLADASAIGTAVVIGFAAEDIANGQPGKYITDGRITRTSWSSIAGTATLTPGARYYLSETTGLITTTSPDATGVSVLVGRALSTTVLDIEVADGVVL